MDVHQDNSINNGNRTSSLLAYHHLWEADSQNRLLSILHFFLELGTMTVSPQNDVEFIEKLENVAGITNSDVLSDVEILRGRILLKKARDVIAQHDSGSTTMVSEVPSALRLPEHISRLCIALAPHKRLPQEILERIFYPDDGYMRQLKLPPRLSDYPWVLGRVCSKWRQLSRSMPKLWHVTIFLGQCGNNGIAYDCQLALRELQCAESILPEAAFLCLSANDSAGELIPTRALIPFLPRFSSMFWSTVCGDRTQESLEVFAPKSLSRLAYLCIALGQPVTEITSYPALFGDCSKLEILRLRSDTPSLLLSDIPWSQLLSFSLETTTQIMNDLTRSSWNQIVQDDPFRRMSSLNLLSFDMRAEYFRLLLCCQFPWHQVAELKVFWRDEDHDLPLLMKSLQNCSSLIRLEVHNYAEPPSAELIYMEFMQIRLPSLQHLRTGNAVPPSMNRSLTLSGSLRSLTIDWIPLSDFYVVASQCPYLIYLTVLLSHGEDVSNISGDIVLPDLRRLEFTVVDSILSFPIFLVAPHVVSLRVYTRSYSNILETASTFILRSSMQLKNLAIIVTEEVMYDPRPQPFRNILSIADYCKDVFIGGIIPPQEVIEDIAYGVFLSHVERLGITSPNPGVYIGTVRYLVERMTGVREILGYIPIGTLNEHDDPGFDMELWDLEESFGVKCTFQLIHR